MSALNDLFDPRRERRNGATRQAAALTAHVIDADWQCYDIDLVEVSATGFRARHSGDVLSEDRIRIAVPGIGPMDARVKWVKGALFGAEFLGAVDMRLLFLGGAVSPRPTWLERIAA